MGCLGPEWSREGDATPLTVPPLNSGEDGMQVLGFVVRGKPAQARRLMGVLPVVLPCPGT